MHIALYVVSTYVCIDLHAFNILNVYAYLYVRNAEKCIFHPTLPLFVSVAVALAAYCIPSFLASWSRQVHLPLWLTHSPTSHFVCSLILITYVCVPIFNIVLVARWWGCCGRFLLQFTIHTDKTDTVAGIVAGFHRELALVVASAVATPE